MSIKHLPLKIWFLATISPIFIAVIIRIIWEVVVNPSVAGLVMSILVILGLLGLYALIAYFTLKPSLEKLKSLPVGIGVLVMATGALIGGFIHLTRFIPSPLVGLPWSMVIAALYLLAAVSAYFLLLWLIWTNWKRQKQK